jgi:S1-C subfamily serine protease
MNNINFYENYVVNIKVSEYVINLEYPEIDEYISSSGTGFYIEHGIILTCYHVVQNTAKINVLTKNKSGDYFLNLAKLKYVFPDDDLAVIELEDKNIICEIFDYNIITKKNIETPINVLTIGFPDDNININQGIISGFNNSKIQTDATLNSGNSGGPLIINDNGKNKVIGINSSYESDSNNKYLSVPIFRFSILYKLNFNKLQFINRKPNFLFEYQYNQQKFYDKDYGVLITEIDKKSIFNLYEIHVGDLITKVNNCKVNYDGSIKFNFYPDHINLYDLGLWFIIGDEIKFTVINNKYEKINIIVKADYIEEKIIDYYPEKNYIKDLKKYMFKKNNFTFSVLTKYHLHNKNFLKNVFKKYSEDYICKLNKFGINKSFIVYLSNVNVEKLPYNITEFPINKIVTEINNKELIDYAMFIKIMNNEELINFKTIDNQIYYIKKIDKE